MSSSILTQAFGIQISKAIFSYFDSGAPFVLLGLSSANHYLCEQSGVISSDRPMIISQMSRYVSEKEALKLWDKHLVDCASRAENQALISGFFYRSDRDPRSN